MFRKDEVLFGLNEPFATDIFTVRIVKMSKDKSSAGNPMITTDIEIVSPETVESGGKKVQVGGTPAKMYGMLDPTNSLGLAKLVSGLERAGLSPTELQGLKEGEIFDEDNLKVFEKKMFQISITCQPRPLMRNPTPAEAKAGVKKTVMKDAKGNEITNGYQLKLDWGNVIGPALEGADSVRKF